MKAREGGRAKVVRDLLKFDNDSAIAADLKKNKGLWQVDEKVLLGLAKSNTGAWAELWKQIRVLDFDNNGFVPQDDFE